MAAAIKLIVTQGTVSHDGTTYRKGEHLSIPGEHAERLIEAGVCKKADAKTEKDGTQKTAEGGK